MKPIHWGKILGALVLRASTTKVLLSSCGYEIRSMLRVIYLLDGTQAFSEMFGPLSLRSSYRSMKSNLLSPAELLFMVISNSEVQYVNL